MMQIRVDPQGLMVMMANIGAWVWYWVPGTGCGPLVVRCLTFNAGAVPVEVLGSEEPRGHRGHHAAASSSAKSVRQNTLKMYSMILNVT